MIYVKKSNVSEQDFLNLLKKSKEILVASLSNVTPILFSEFEDVVCEKVNQAARGTFFENTIRKTGKHDFPDIIANNYFGIEVKMTIKDQWTSTGNSILESSRPEEVQRIYILFGKFGGKFDVAFRLYQECLPEITVTHSPRYRIDMNLPEGSSIFDKMKIDYNSLRSDPHPIERIKDYYRSQLKDGDGLWWIDHDGASKTVSPVIRQFRNLSEVEKECFIVDSMILFPEIFGHGNTKYSRPAAYLISEYNSVSTSMRDSFSAGGQVPLKISGKNMYIPRMLYNMATRSDLIRKRLKPISGKTLAFNWRIEAEKDRLAQWKKILDSYSEPIKKGVFASDIFDVSIDGLRNGLRKDGPWGE